MGLKESKRIFAPRKRRDNERRLFFPPAGNEMNMNVVLSLGEQEQERFQTFSGDVRGMSVTTKTLWTWTATTAQKKKKTAKTCVPYFTSSLACFGVL